MKHILEQFAIPNSVATPCPLKIGIINDSYIVPALQKGEPSYFLQKINHHIFTDIDGLQRNIQIVTDHIRSKLQATAADDIQRRVLQLIPTKDGRLYYHSQQGDYWRLYVLIERAFSQEQVTITSARLAGEAFGEFQAMLADLPFSLLTESIPNFHNIEFRLQQLHEAIEADRVGRVQQQQQLIEQLLQRSSKMCLPEQLFREGKLPKRINHCDTKVNNILFDEAGVPLCIVDLDTVMSGFVLSDFGDFMRTAANTGREDDRNLDNIHVNLAVFEAYTQGYLSKATFLTPMEKDLLPFGCCLLSYMQAVRFLTDYLNGDTYYKTAYSDHNLVRTQAQLRLLEEQEQAEDAMKCIVSKYSKAYN